MDGWPVESTQMETQRNKDTNARRRRNNCLVSRVRIGIIVTKQLCPFLTFTRHTAFGLSCKRTKTTALYESKTVCLLSSRLRWELTIDRYKTNLPEVDENTGGAHVSTETPIASHCIVLYNNTARIHSEESLSSDRRNIPCRFRCCRLGVPSCACAPRFLACRG